MKKKKLSPSYVSVYRYRIKWCNCNCAFERYIYTRKYRYLYTLAVLLVLSKLNCVWTQPKAKLIYYSKHCKI